LKVPVRQQTHFKRLLMDDDVDVHNASERTTPQEDQRRPIFALAVYDM